MTDVLNRLLDIQCCSLANYLNETQPWTNVDNEVFKEGIRAIAKDHEHYARRLAEAIDQHGGHVNFDSYPMTFASLNDLGLDYLLQRLIPSQLASIKAIEECVSELGGDGPMVGLAQDVLGSERGHLDALRRLSEQRKSILNQSAIHSSSA